MKNLLNVIMKFKKMKLIKMMILMPLALIAVRRLEKLTSINKKVSSEILNNIKELKDPSSIADHIASHLNMTISENSKFLKHLTLKKD